MKNFVFLNIAKIASWGLGRRRRLGKNRITARYWGASGSWMHDLRILDTANADQARYASNRIWCAETGWEGSFLTEETLRKTGCKSPHFVERKAKARIASFGISPTKDQVKIVIALCSISPEFLRDGDLNNDQNPETVRCSEDAIFKFAKQRFGENLLAVVAHRDESNSHLTCYVTPILEKKVKKRGRPPKRGITKPKTDALEMRWALCAKDMFTPNRKGVEGTCAKLQTDFAEFLKKEGLDVRRGVRRREHQELLAHRTNREMYETLSRAAKDAESLMTVEELREVVKQLAAESAEYDYVVKQRNYYQEVAADAQAPLESTIVQLGEQLENLQAENEKLRREAEMTARTVACAEVMLHLKNLRPTSILMGEQRFILSTGQMMAVNPTTNKFRFQSRDLEGLGNMKGKFSGQGALDLVIYLTGWSKDESMKWIADSFGFKNAEKIWKEEMHADLGSPARAARQFLAVESAFSAIRNSESRWKKLKAHLVGNNHDPILLDTLHHDYRVFANREGHLVLAMTDTPGAYDGTTISGHCIIDVSAQLNVLYEMTTSDEGVFELPARNAKRVVMVQNPLDGFAMRQDPAFDDALIVYAGRSGTKQRLALIKDLAARFEKFYFAVQHVGGKISEWISINIKSIVRLDPPVGSSSWCQRIETAIPAAQAASEVGRPQKADDTMEQEESQEM